MPTPASVPPVLAFSQGDPAGVGPEILLKALIPEVEGTPSSSVDFVAVLFAEWAALEALEPVLPRLRWDRLSRVTEVPSRETLATPALGRSVLVIDPVQQERSLALGASGAADAAGAMAALDAASRAVVEGRCDALVTAPVSKSSIARHGWPGFRGHTEYLAQASGRERYGRDYLMAFLAPDLQVALLSVHVPLRRALDDLRSEQIEDSLVCLDRVAGGRIAVAGLNPHAGEEGLLGSEDEEIVRPAIAAARRRGVDAHGPESADSLFARVRQGEFDWALALYHDQGLVAVKTASFGLATNWTLGLPYVRTSVDHGTAFAIAGRGVADERPMRGVIATTLDLLAGRLPRRRPRLPLAASC